MTAALLAAAVVVVTGALAPRAARADDDDVTYTVRLDANGGAFAEGIEGATYEGGLTAVISKAYAKLATFDAPTRPYLRLAGWASTALDVDATPQVLPGETVGSAVSYPVYTSHSKLSDYTIPELQAVSAYLTDLYDSVGGDTTDARYTGDDVYKEFHGYLLEGQTFEPRGSTGTLTLNDDTHSLFRLRIVGINHDERAADGKRAGLTLMFADRLPVTAAMNSSGGNSGGWQSSQMRTDTLGNDGTLTGKRSGAVWDLLPSELTDAIVAVHKRSDNTGGTGTHTPGITTDLLWLPSYVEVFGSTTSYVTAGEGTGYEWFTAASSPSRRAELTRLYGETSGSRDVWLRSVYTNHTGIFWYVGANGSANSTYGANSPYGVAPGFSL